MDLRALGESYRDQLTVLSCDDTFSMGDFGVRGYVSLQLQFPSKLLDDYCAVTGQDETPNMGVVWQELDLANLLREKIPRTSNNTELPFVLDRLNKQNMHIQYVSSPSRNLKCILVSEMD